jgi:hypothetical protein
MREDRSHLPGVLAFIRGACVGQYPFFIDAHSISSVSLRQGALFGDLKLTQWYLSIVVDGKEFEWLYKLKEDARADVMLIADHLTKNPVLSESVRVRRL